MEKDLKRGALLGDLRSFSWPRPVARAKQPLASCFMQLPGLESLELWVKRVQGFTLSQLGQGFKGLGFRGLGV